MKGRMEIGMGNLIIRLPFDDETYLILAIKPRTTIQTFYICTAICHTVFGRIDIVCSQIAMYL